MDLAYAKNFSRGRTPLIAALRLQVLPDWLSIGPLIAD
jgi:hypothetical protein